MRTCHSHATTPALCPRCSAHSARRLARGGPGHVPEVSGILLPEPWPRLRTPASLDPRTLSTRVGGGLTSDRPCAFTASRCVQRQPSPVTKAAAWGVPADATHVTSETASGGQVGPGL